MLRVNLLVTMVEGAGGVGRRWPLRPVDVALASGFRVYLTTPLDPMTVVVEIERLYWESQDAA
jgi:hypothetical protein